MLARPAIFVGLVGCALVLAVAGCRALSAGQSTPAAGGQAQSSSAGPASSSPSGDVVWGKVPYCTCLQGKATANVAGALKDAHLTVSLKELYPSDGWLYFTATFDSHAASRDQVAAAIAAGGGQVLAGPP